jgi:hypothetical protein
MQCKLRTRTCLSNILRKNALRSNGTRAPTEGPLFWCHKNWPKTTFHALLDILGKASMPTHRRKKIVTKEREGYHVS